MYLNIVLAEASTNATMVRRQNVSETSHYTHKQAYESRAL